jgi:flagellar hook-basal body complex protein FliE
MSYDAFGVAARRVSQFGLDSGARQVPVIKQGEVEGPSFGDVLKNAINEVSASQDNAADYTQRFLRGEPVELHQVMAASEEAGIALETMIEVRNKVLDAYRTIINMQS